MPPAQQQQQPQVPPGTGSYDFENFAGINTSLVRAGVPNEQMFWCDGWMPIGRRNLRTLPDVGVSIFTASNGVVALGTITPGSGGSGGPFSAVPLTGGHGTSVSATVTLSGGSVSTVVVTAEGQNYKVGDVLSAASGNIGSVTGFSVPVTTVVTVVAPPFFFVLNPISVNQATEYCALLLSDGSVVAVNLGTSAQTTILPIGTVNNPSPTNTGFTQYDEEYLIIVSSQSSGNGYWVWDGTLLYQAGSLGPNPLLTNPGSGYFQTPFVAISGGSGSGAAAVATINGAGNVDNIVLTAVGSGYLPGQTVSLVCTGGNRSGSGASITAVLTHDSGGSGASLSAAVTESSHGINTFYYYLSSVTISSGGSGYSQFTTIGVTSNATYTLAAATVQPVIAGGIITGVTITSGGNYEVVGSSTPPTLTLTVSDGGAYVVSGTSIHNAGSTYSPSAIATASGGGSPVSQATFELFETGGSISSVVILSGGIYGSNTPPSISVTDAAVNATATATLMPFGIQGTAVNTYGGFVIVVDGPNVNGSAPGSVTDFASGDGGISFTSNSSNIKVGYTALVSTNGYLYFVGDSSVDYMSGLTTSGSPPTTNYTFLNIDPEVGSPYPSSVLTFGNLFILANAVGIYIFAGSTGTKASEALDGSGMPNGLWNSVANFGGTQLSAAKAVIFGRKVFMVLATVLDPISGLQVNKLFMSDGKKWWASQQSVPLLFVGSSEFNSVLTAYGTDGTKVYPLFQTPGTGFSKIVQSKFFDDPGYGFFKTESRLWGVTYVYSTSSPSFTVTMDNENGSSSPYSITPASVGYYVWPPQAVAQNGVFSGITLTTNAADEALISLSVGYENLRYRG